MLGVYFSSCWVFIFPHAGCLFFLMLGVYFSSCWVFIFPHTGCLFFLMLGVYFSSCWVFIKYIVEILLHEFHTFDHVLCDFVIVTQNVDDTLFVKYTCPGETYALYINRYCGIKKCMFTQNIKR